MQSTECPAQLWQASKTQRFNGHYSPPNPPLSQACMLFGQHITIYTYIRIAAYMIYICVCVLLDELASSVLYLFDFVMWSYLKKNWPRREKTSVRIQELNQHAVEAGMHKAWCSIVMLPSLIQHLSKPSTEQLEAVCQETSWNLLQPLYTTFLAMAVQLHPISWLHFASFEATKVRRGLKV